MVYARDHVENVLSFEASGALKDASLIMRDRETDSWWSIMAGEAIGGALEGTALRELPIGQKTTWGDWQARHADTRVLSIDGKTHVEENVYAGYFATPKTYLDLTPEDDRLSPKTPIFAFRWRGRPHAVPYTAITGGGLFALGEDEGCVYLERPAGARLLESTRAVHVAPSLLGAPSQCDADTKARVRAALRDEEAGGGEETGLARLTGFDTYWYVWAPQNEGTRILE